MFDNLPQKYISIFRENRLEPVDAIEVAIDDLYNQENFYISFNDLFVDKDGRTSWGIKDSPMYEFLKVYKERGRFYLFSRLFFTRWYEMRKKAFVYNHKEKIKRFKYRKRLFENIRFFLFLPKSLYGNATKFLRVYKSIEENGYLGGGFSNHYIGVLKKPFIVSRFKQKRDRRSYEIWLGHHRVAILAFLGYKRLKVLLLKDMLEQNESPSYMR